MRLCLLILLATTAAHAAPFQAPPAYAALFEANRTWKLAVVVTGDAPEHATMTCKVTDVKKYDDAVVSRISCSSDLPAEGYAQGGDWGAGVPGGVFVVDKTGLHHPGGLEPKLGDDDVRALLAARPKTDVPLLASAPRAARAVSREAAGGQTVKHLKYSRAYGKGWCYTEADSFDGSDRTLCVDAGGLIGARLRRNRGDPEVVIGKVPPAMTRF